MAKDKLCSKCETKNAAWDDWADNEAQGSAADEIYASFTNGQGRQMVEQIDANGAYDTVTALEELGVSEREQLLIWKKYLRIKHR